MKYFLAFIFSCLLACQAFAQPTTSILDNFNRTDEDPVSGIWTNGTTASGECKVSSNQLTFSTGDGSCHVTQTFSANQELFLTLANGSTMIQDNNQEAFICLQGTFGTSSVNGYGFRWRRVSTGNDLVQLVKLTAGTTSNLGTAYTGMGEFADTDRVAVTITATGTLTLYYDDGGAGWNQVDQVTGETTYTCSNTNIGVRLSSTSVIVDDVGGGNTGFSLLLGASPFFAD